MPDIGGDFSKAVAVSDEATRSGIKTQQENESLQQEDMTSGLNYLRDASGKAIDFMTQQNRQKALLQGVQLKQEGELAKQQMIQTGKRQEVSDKLSAEKAKHDYENFFTMTPEIAQGIYNTSKGKLDFRKRVGERMLTKAVLPLVTIAGHEAEASIRGENKDKNKTSAKDLNALKSFTKQYESVQKEWEDPIKVRIARSNPETAKILDQKQKWLKDKRKEYDDATSKVEQMGGVDSSSGSDDNNSSAPPATSSSDEDKLIDQMMQ